MAREAAIGVPRTLFGVGGVRLEQAKNYKEAFADSRKRIDDTVLGLTDPPDP